MAPIVATIVAPIVAPILARRLRWVFAVALGLLSTAAARAEVPVRIGYETGPAYVAQNDGRYGATGTAYQAAEVGQQKNLARVQRAAVELQPGRHRLAFTYIPFELRTRVTLARELRFRDTVFPGGTVVDHRYLFDGLRFSYLYQLLPGPLSLDLGGSLQIRNADVAFTSADGTRHAAQDDIGPVVALKARLRYAPRADGTWAELDADALSTFGLLGDTSGGIYDLALILGVPVHPRLDVTFSARLYGGGADVPAQAFRNWANFLSLNAGLALSLP
jgi:hypothetical protein